MIIIYFMCPTLKSPHICLHFFYFYFFFLFNVAYEYRSHRWPFRSESVLKLYIFQSESLHFMYIFTWLDEFPAVIFKGRFENEADYLWIWLDFSQWEWSLANWFCFFFFFSTFPYFLLSSWPPLFSRLCVLILCDKRSYIHLH